MINLWGPGGLPPWSRAARARRALWAVRLGPGDLAIDCGANVGEITAQLGRNGATVHAFEPNPFAHAELVRRCAHLPNVHCRPQGVLDRAGTARLYFHENSDADEVHWSTGSSLLDFKSNVRKGKFVDVEVIDLGAFIAALPGRVKVLKLDVEGVEVPIVERLIETGAVARIDHVFVETHEKKIPELAAATQALRDRIRRERLQNVNLDWE